MLKEAFAAQRALKTVDIDCDLVVVGGGLAGTCCAITAARAGIKVLLMQDRPVLGGNASSEVRLWTLGATAHMGAPNRWAREGGVIDEILVENMWRNPEGNALLFDLVMLEKVVSEPNLTLLLNTAVFEAVKSDANRVASVRAFCSQNSTLYVARAPLFCDASGDGILAFLAGGAFRMGAESREEFGEKFAPSQEYGELLGHSIYFYSKDLGRPVNYVPPAFALEDITKIPRFRNFNTREQGCKLWWIEYGGRLDTVHETETIKWELWKVVYGVWNHIKNSGKFPEAENLTLEWVGHVPGKRESRRFEGDYLMIQQDVIEQRQHSDAVAFGGWALDLHPADGVFSEKPGCTHWRMRGIYGIPYRSLYSKNIDNLFLAGRIISVSHAAYGSTRVMATLAHAAQAVGMAAAQCARDKVLPRAIMDEDRLAEVQRDLMRSGQHIPNFSLNDPDDLAQSATLKASSELRLAHLPADGPLLPLDRSRAQLLPLQAGRVPVVSFVADVAQPTTVELQLRTSSKPGNFDGNEILATKTISLGAGLKQRVVADFELTLDSPQYAFYGLMKNEDVSLHTSEQRLTGVLSLRFAYFQNPSEEARAVTSPGAADIGVESFDVWLPDRRPNGRNLACDIEPPLAGFSSQNLTNGVQRPTDATNAWLADLNDKRPTLTLSWAQPKSIGRIELSLDTDYDHPMESVLMGHPERAMPFCLKHFRLLDGRDKVLWEEADNHQSRHTIRFETPIETDTLRLELLESWGQVPAALFEIRCYAA